MTKISKWFKTKYPGVRYREHPERKHGVGYDRYYALQYRVGNVVKNEGLGWASEGMKAEDAAGILGELRRAQKVGQGPQTLAETRQIEESRRQAQEAETRRKAKEAITFSEVFTESYFPLAKASKIKWTWAREDSLFRLWINPVIGDKPLKDVVPFHLEKIKKNMAEAGKAARSIHYALAVIRQVFNFARNHSLYTGENPVSKVKKPTADNKRIRFLSHEEAETLLNALANKSQEVYEMSLLSLHCGLRASEIFTLTWGDVDLDRDLLTLRNTKNGKTRAAFMTSEVKARLQAKARGGHNDLIWPGRTGARNQISKTFDRIVSELGFNRGITDPRQKVVFHSLRHTYASWLVENGTDLYVVRTLLGHESLDMTKRYSHLGENSLRSAVRRFDRSLEESKKAEIIEFTR